MCNSFDSIYSANRLLWCETSVGVLWFWPSDHQLRRSMKEQTTLIKKSHLAKKRFEILTQSLLHQTFKFLTLRMEIGNGDLDLHCLYRWLYADVWSYWLILVPKCSWSGSSIYEASVLQQFLISNFEETSIKTTLAYVWITVESSHISPKLFWSQILFIWCYCHLKNLIG